ncbi:MAG: hypothetical protein IKT52_08820, partial [Oscillospiraceae bacterium]|nr:hypothetical protein [Oscillospiraceae bacterium]
GNRPILIRCALQHARRYNVTNSPKSNASSQHFSARATNGRPYVIHGTQRDKHQFVAKKDRKKAVRSELPFISLTTEESTPAAE